MELQILDAVAGGGSAVVLAVIIFIMYRADKNEEIKRWETQAKHQTELNKELINVREVENRTREDLTRALTELTIAVKNKN